MSFKKIFMIMMILIIALGVSAVSAEDLTADNDMISIDDGGIAAISLDETAADYTPQKIDDNNTVKIVADNATFFTGNDKKYSIKVLDNETPLSNQNVTFVIGNDFKSNSITDGNGVAILDLTFLKAGNYNIEAQCNGVVAKATITVKDTVVGNDITKYYKNATQYYATLYDETGKPLSGVKAQVTINGQSYNRTTNASGKIKFDINLPAGVYTIFVKNPVTNETINNTVTVLATLKAENITKYFKNGTQYIISAFDGQGKPLSGVKLSINVNGQLYERTTKSDGKAQFDINLPPDTYKITVTNKDNNEIISNQVTVLPTLFVNNVTKYFKNGTQYIITAIDGQGKPLSGAKLSINVNGQVYTRTTKSDGKAQFDINLPPGTYTVTVNSVATNEFASSKVTVLPTLFVNNLQKYYKNDTQYLITAIDGQGKPLAGEKLSINVNGDNYTRTTNASGIAKFDINLPPGTYTVTVNSVKNNEVVSSKVTVLPTLSVKNVQKYFMDDTQYYITALNGQGKPLSGSKLSINVNGQTYTRTTNASGIAKFDINLPVGKYTVTVTSPTGEVASSTVTVLANLFVKNVQKYYKNDTQYYITALNTPTTPYANTIINITVNNMTYQRTTNASGVAKFDINLPPGKYTINVVNTANGDKASSTVTVLPTLSVKNVQKYFMDDTQYYITALNGQGKPLEGAKLTVKINGQSYTRTTNASGIAKFDVNLPPGKYTVNVVSANGESVSSNVTVLPNLFVKNVQKYYKNGTQYYIEAYTTPNNPSVNSIIDITINNQTYHRTTNASGIAKFDVNLPAGKYNVDVVNTANGDKASSTITVLPTIIGENLSKYEGNSTPYTFKTLDGQGKPLANVSVTLNINGGIYKRTTNENGTASLPINLPVGKYTITVTNPENGEIITSTITILSHIVGVTTKVTYNSGGKISFKVVDSQGKGLANKSTTINLNGQTYKRTTDKDGIVSLTVGLPVGVYPCNVKADGYSQDFNITVNKRSLTVTIMSSTVKRGEYYKTKLADGKTPVEGVLVYYVYDYGQSSQRVFGNYTQSNGIAQLIVDLNPGTYQFLIGVQDNPIYSNVFISSTLTVKA